MTLTLGGQIFGMIGNVDYDFGMNDFSVLRAFFTEGKGDNPMEGGRGVVPPQYCGGIY